LLHWWPEVVETAKKAKPGTFWHIPNSFAENGSLRQVSSEDMKLLKIERQMAQGEAIRAERKRKKEAYEQGTFNFNEPPK